MQSSIRSDPEALLLWVSKSQRTLLGAPTIVGRAETIGADHTRAPCQRSSPRSPTRGPRGSGRHRAWFKKGLRGWLLERWVG